MESKVSVIIPMYNSEKYIGQCLSSVVNQTYKNLEIIVIDDNSSDASVDVARSFNDDRIKLIELLENQGVSTARNKGIELAEGDYLCFIDSDDIWVLDKIEKQLEFIQKNEYEFIYSNYAYLSERHNDNSLLSLEEIYKINNLKTTNVPLNLTYNQAIKNHTIFVSSVMIDMHKLTKEDIYMPNYAIAQDTATWWKILKQGITAHAMSDVLAYYRVGIKSLSSNKFKAVLGTWRIFLKEKISWLRKIYGFSCYIKNAILRRI